MNGVPMKFDYSKTINEQLPTFHYYKDRYCSYELELINDRKEIERLNNIIKQQDTRNSRQRIANRKLLERNQDLVIENLKSNNIINELKWKPIEEYDKGNYDWVLVKYFDGDYECVPCVAEKRFGKWHSIDEKEIQFDVRYFMDMQQIDKLQELKGVDKE